MTIYLVNLHHCLPFIVIYNKNKWSWLNMSIIKDLKGRHQGSTKDPPRISLPQCGHDTQSQTTWRRHQDTKHLVSQWRTLLGGTWGSLPSASFHCTVTCPLSLQCLLSAGWNNHLINKPFTIHHMCFKDCI